MPETITLGAVEIDVLPQRHAYLSNRLGPAIQQAFNRGEGLTADGLIEFAAEGTYDVLCALIPKLSQRMPRWQFLGYGSQTALDAGEYDEATDESPTLPEIREAFVVALRTNCIDELGKLLGKVVDPQLIRGQVNLAVANSLASPSLPSTSGGSESTSSGPTSPTSTASEDTQSPASPA
jgi:hypothetical protein